MGDKKVSSKVVSIGLKNKNHVCFDKLHSHLLFLKKIAKNTAQWVDRGK